MRFERDDVSYVEGDRIVPSGASKKAVEAYASSVARSVGLTAGGSVSALTTALGGRIRYRELDELMVEHGSIYVHGVSDFDIILPQFTSPRRDRFTIAHELGHYFVHSKQGEIPIIATRSGSTRIEWEANWFAAALLMPETEFLTEWKATLDLRIVASRFDVSEQAAEIRRKSLNA